MQERMDLEFCRFFRVHVLLLPFFLLNQRFISGELCLAMLHFQKRLLLLQFLEHRLGNFNLIDSLLVRSVQISEIDIINTDIPCWNLTDGRDIVCESTSRGDCCRSYPKLPVGSSYKVRAYSLEPSGVSRALWQQFPFHVATTLHGQFDSHPASVRATRCENVINDLESD